MRKSLLFCTIILCYLCSTTSATLSAATSATLAAKGEVIEVTDSQGDTQTLEQTPTRVACLYAFTGHTVVMLGKSDTIIAVVRGLKRDKLLARIFPELKKIATPAKGGEINIEALLKTRPDMVFLKPETAKIKGEINKLNRFNLPYYVAGYRSMEEQMNIIENMGKILGASDRAQQYTSYYRGVIQRVQGRVATIPADKHVRLYHSINEAYRTTGAHTIEAEWTAVAGVINVSVDAHLKQKGDKNFASMEQILLWNPEVIIANEASVKEDINRDKKWAHIDAVKSKRVYSIPIGISRWGHPGGLETPLAILWTAKTVYPEYFKDINLEKEIRFFYQNFFNLSVTDNDIKQILSGKGMRQKRQ